MNLKKTLKWISIIFLIIILLGVVGKFRNKSSSLVNTGLTGCGNGVCEDNETDRNCKSDCCNKVFQEEADNNCLKRGWNKS